MIDGCVAGNISSTANIIKAGLHTVGKQLGIDTISSFLLWFYQMEQYIHMQMVQ